MQTTKLKQFISLVSLNKESIRTVAATAAVKSDTNLKSWKEIPGLSSLPIIGPLHHFMPGGSLHNLQGPERNMRLFKMYGPIVRVEGMLGKPPMVILFDPESCAKVLRAENEFPVRPGFESLAYYRKVYRKGKGRNTHATGLITEHGDLWKDLRSKVNPVLMQPKTIKLYTTVLDKVALDMIERLKDKRDEKNMIRNNFDHEIKLWALESIGTVALGCRLNCFDPNLPANSPVWQLIQCVNELLIAANKLDFEPSISRYFSTPYFKKTMKQYEVQEKLTKYFIKIAKEQLNDKETGTEKGVLEKLLEIDENIAHIIASDLISAGVDTISITVIATLYLLAINPEKQDKLREEILSKSERRSYMRACMKESLRTMPAVSGNLRVATQEYNLLGYRIPKNVHILFAHQNMSLFEEHYPRPQEYIPERWLANENEPLYYRNAHPFAHAPFGFGVRTCIGRRIAELEIETLVARVVENFHVEWIGPPPNITHSALNYIKPPFNFIFNDIAR